MNTSDPCIRPKQHPVCDLVPPQIQYLGVNTNPAEDLGDSEEERKGDLIDKNKGWRANGEEGRESEKARERHNEV